MNNLIKRKLIAHLHCESHIHLPNPHKQKSRPCPLQPPMTISHILLISLLTLSFSAPSKGLFTTPNPSRTALILLPDRESVIISSHSNILNAARELLNTNLTLITHVNPSSHDISSWNSEQQQLGSKLQALNSLLNPNKLTNFSKQNQTNVDDILDIFQTESNTHTLMLPRMKKLKRFTYGKGQTVAKLFDSFVKQGHIQPANASRQILHLLTEAHFNTLLLHKKKIEEEINGLLNMIHNHGYIPYRSNLLLRAKILDVSKTPSNSIILTFHVVKLRPIRTEIFFVAKNKCAFENPGKKDWTLFECEDNKVDLTEISFYAPRVESLDDARFFNSSESPPGTCLNAKIMNSAYFSYYCWTERARFGSGLPPSFGKSGSGKANTKNMPQKNVKTIWRSASLVLKENQIVWPLSKMEWIPERIVPPQWFESENFFITCASVLAFNLIISLVLIIKLISIIRTQNGFSKWAREHHTMLGLPRINRGETNPSRYYFGVNSPFFS